MPSISELTAHLCWLVAMTVAAGSVFALNAMRAKWLYMIQAVTPFVTFSSLTYLHDKSFDRGPGGESLVVCSVCSSVLSVPGLILLYATMIGLGWTDAVFYFALLAKAGLWVVGHTLIFQAQEKNRRKALLFDERGNAPASSFEMLG